MVNISATGTVTWGKSGIEEGTNVVGPDGTRAPYRGDEALFPIPKAGIGSLVMRIGKDKYAVGSRDRVEAKDNGTIELMVNDDNVADNTGTFNVSITVSNSVQTQTKPDVVSTKRNEPVGGENCGLKLDEYCRMKYGGDSISVLVENNALGWRCEDRQIGSRKLVKIDMDDACKTQHGVNSTAFMRDAKDFESWGCKCR